MIKIKFNYLLIIVALAGSLASCKKEFVDIDPKGQFLSENYYKDKDQAFGGLVGVYDVMRKNSGGFENMITMMNAGSDDHYAGGGGATDGAGIQSFSNYTISELTMPASFWNDHYQGIFRANTLLAKLPNTNMDASLKARFEAEAKALRAYYYFNLVRMFKNIPLLLEPLSAEAIYDVVQVAPSAVYTQIEQDLNDAIAVLPPTVPLATEGGRFTKGSAQALLGKVYLYQDKKPQAAAQFAEVNGVPGQTSQYGYRLLDNFSDLWVVANKFNSESIIEVGHSSAGNSDWGFWGSSFDEGNTVNIMVGPRSYSRPAGSPAPDLPSGWSFNVFTQDFYDFIKMDP
ncbi:MAG TPA: RagB/SusD family nutrient uptake outer membrane protein, partial [Flavisolibacter sp.]